MFLASRDAGTALTLDALRAGISLTTVTAAAKDLGKYVDDALAIVRDEYEPRLDCQVGCAYCCCKPGVLVSLPELVLVLADIQATLSGEALAGLRERARRYASQIRGRSFNALVNESVPCPLLVDNRCSVYAVRPLVCRGYNSSSVNACHEAQTNAEMLVPIFAPLKDVADGAIVGAARSLSRVGVSDSMFDLGTALDIALSSDECDLEALLQNTGSLMRAEDATWVANLWRHVTEIAREVGVNPD